MKKFTNRFFLILRNRHHVLGRTLSGGCCLGNMRGGRVNEDSRTVDQCAEKWEVEQSLDNGFLSVREDVESLWCQNEWEVC